MQNASVADSASRRKGRRWKRGIAACRIPAHIPLLSFERGCKDQSEVDYYWDKLRAGGDPAAQVCGWLKDRYGVSWQIVPALLPEMLGDPDAARSQRAMAAMLTMKKIDIETLKRAFAG
jgi:predicted 3-demethylubiquinone-9 3-methyltransferase (glyoxalase superfamily)